jgi:hypothetical protein
MVNAMMTDGRFGGKSRSSIDHRLIDHTLVNSSSPQSRLGRPKGRGSPVVAQGDQGLDHGPILAYGVAAVISGFSSR